MERKKEKGYRYNRHTFPFDIEVKELGTGVTRRETLYKLGMRNIITGKKLLVVDGIDAVRRVFSKFVFDEEKCKKLTDSLSSYRKEYDHKLMVFKDKPRHDENSHFADPVRLLALEWREQIESLHDDDHVQSTSFFG